jgi:hypothetical protein
MLGMGLFYFSVTTKGPSQDELADYFRALDRKAVISPSVDTITTAFDWEFRGGGVIRRIARADLSVRGATAWEPVIADLSSHFACVALAAEVYDDDVFYYQLYEAGGLRDEFCSDVMDFGMDAYIRLLSSEDLSMLFGRDHAARLCDAFGVRSDYDNVRAALDVPYQTLPAQNQHTALVRALGLPEYARYQGYTRWDDNWIETRPNIAYAQCRSCPTSRRGGGLARPGFPGEAPW